jgi:hypothetical protein
MLVKTRRIRTISRPARKPGKHGKWGKKKDRRLLMRGRTGVTQSSRFLQRFAKNDLIVPGGVKVAQARFLIVTLLQVEFAG